MTATATRQEFDAAMQIIVTRATREQIEEIAAMLPDEQADNLRMVWHYNNTPDFRKFVVDQVRAHTR